MALVKAATNFACAAQFGIHVEVMDCAGPILTIGYGATVALILSGKARAVSNCALMEQVSRYLHRSLNIAKTEIY